MRYFALSNTGRREHNEDSLFIPRRSDVSLAVVADGMGGHNAGEIASALAIAAFVEKINRGGVEPPEKLFEQAFDAANAAVYSLSRQKAEYRGMGTTMVAVMPLTSCFLAANIGDSRLYHIHGKDIHQVTKDHSYVEELVEAGYITRAQAAVHPKRNIITRAIGTSKSEKIDIFKQSWERGDVLLLCTDGLHSAIEPEEIARIIQEDKNDLQGACARLIDNALYGGSTDNISAVLVLNEEE